MLTKKVALILTGKSFPQRAPIGGPTRFQPGHTKIGGRTKGARNKVSLEFAEEVLAALAEHGTDGKGTGGLRGRFLWLALHEPKTYLTLLHGVLRAEERANRPKIRPPV